MEEVKKSSYTEAQKRATKKYRDNNKEKVNQQRKLYYQNRKDKDPNFLLYKRQKAKEYYNKKKQLKKDNDKKIEEAPKELLDYAISKTELFKTINDVISNETKVVNNPVEKVKRVYKKKKTE